MAVLFKLLFAIAALPFVFATDDSCDSGQFMYEAKSCCVPYGGSPSPPSPPSGIQCPPSGWDWHDEKQCCVPHQPVSSQPSPQCNSGWEWHGPSSTCCESGGSPPSPSSPKPSSAPGKVKRHQRSRQNHN